MFHLEREDGMENYRSKIEKIQEKGNLYRLGKTFYTSSSLYFLDTGTGKVYKVKENVYRVLDCLLKTNSFDNLYKIDLPKDDIIAALDEICEAIEKEHILSAPCLSEENICGEHFKLEDSLQHNMSSITLELTEQCNLRCRYCVYSDTNEDYRTFGEQDMSFDTAKKAIDFLMAHSPKGKQLYLGLYGGEPLLRFPLIKDITQYVMSEYPERDVCYSMTSNMTLMNEEIAGYLATVEKFSIVVSMDGPEEVYNSKRVFPNGEGAFEGAIKGLRTYLKARENTVNAREPIAFSVVLTEPYTAEKFDKINKFFEELKKECKCIILVSYVSKTAECNEYIEINDRIENQWEDKLKRAEIYDPLALWTLNNIEQNNFSMQYFRRGSLLEIHKRNLCNKPIDKYGLNGCCVPGARRLYVTVKGKFLPCERIGTQSPIGNVDTGFDIDIIRKNYVEDFVKQEIKYCGECWAVNICNNCYMDCFGDKKVNFAYRHQLCTNTRKRISESLSIYHEVMERKPEMIEELNSVMIE